MTLPNRNPVPRARKVGDGAFVVPNPDAPQLGDDPVAMQDFLGTFSERAAHDRARKAAADRDWLVAYLKTYPDRIDSREQLIDLAVERRMAGVDWSNEAALDQARRLREIAIVVWEEYEAGRVEARPYRSNARDSKERYWITAQLRGRPEQSADDLARISVRYLVTYNNALSEAQRPIAVERVIELAHEIWQQAQAEREAADHEQGLGALTPKSAETATGSITQPADSSAPAPSSDVRDTPTFIAKDEHDSPFSVTLPEPSLEQAEELMHVVLRPANPSLPGWRGTDMPRRYVPYRSLSDDTLAEIAATERARFERNGMADAHRRWRGAVVILKSREQILASGAAS